MCLLGRGAGGAIPPRGGEAGGAIAPRGGGPGAPRAGRRLTRRCARPPAEASWLGAQPQFWSKAQVLDWVAYQVEKSRVDASTIDFSRCDMDGAMLCSCAPEDLRHVFGPLGDQLYTQLWNLSECRPCRPGSPLSPGGWCRPRVSPGAPEGQRSPPGPDPTLLPLSVQLPRRAQLDHRPAGEGQHVLPGDAGGPGPLW